MSRFVQLVKKLTHRHFKSVDDYFRKRTKFGEVNEFLKRQIISSDSHSYTLPFLTNPFRSKLEKKAWDIDDDETIRGGLDYEYADPEDRKEAIPHFDLAYGLVNDRVPKDAVLFDVGCSAGFFLEQWRDKGFKNLHGLDPHKGSIAHAHKKRPYLKVEQGYFGPPENDVICDLLIFFQTIFRVAYEDNLFEAIDRCSKKYVLIFGVEDSCNLFVRDLHKGLAQKAFICIEKRVVSLDFIPFGHEGADGPMLDYRETGGLEPQIALEPQFTAHYLFRRVQPREQ